MFKFFKKNTIILDGINHEINRVKKSIRINYGNKSVTNALNSQLKELQVLRENLLTFGKI